MEIEQQVSALKKAFGFKATPKRLQPVLDDNCLYLKAGEYIFLMEYISRSENEDYTYKEATIYLYVGQIKVIDQEGEYDAFQHVTVINPSIAEMRMLIDLFSRKDPHADRF